MHSTYHYRGQYFFSQNVFNSFSTKENWMGVMALSIYFGKTSIWMGRDNSFQIKITCKPKLCRNSQKLILCIITQIIKNIQKAFGYTFELETTQWRRGNHCSRNFKILSKIMRSCIISKKREICMIWYANKSDLVVIRVKRQKCPITLG